VVLLWKSFYEPSEQGALNALLLSIPAAVYLLAGAVLLLAAAYFARRLAFHGRTGPALLCMGAGLLLAWTAGALAWPALSQNGLPWWQRLLATPTEPYRWLTDTRTAMLACVLPMAWAGIGPGSLVYLAALKGISDDFYEAADLDGATFSDKVIFIIVPLLRPLLVINFVGVFIGAWIHASAGVLAMTGGAAQTEVADLRIFYQAYLFLQFGPATAMAWVLAFLLIGFTVQQLKMLARVEFRAAEKADT
jgi:multiple sugar transport system permease protein